MIIPVILSGGAGTRLWPLSTAARPKQLLALAGPETMLQATARRASDPSLFEAPMVVANAAHAGDIEEQLRASGIEPAALILEPHARNTAPAIALAAVTAKPDALLLVMPSDQVIRDEEGFRAAVRTALPLAEQGWLVTFGITPDRPETGYGYIRRGEPLGPGTFRVDSFVEKPDAERAAAYLAEGGYDWNGGIFLLRADAYLAELDRQAPDIAASVRAAVERAEREGFRLLPNADSFAGARSQSIDYAVMEKAERVAVVPADINWSDVGSFEALHQIKEQDESGNVVGGDTLAIGSRGCLIQSSGPLVVAVGVTDLVVVATPEAVLVVPRTESQRVKEAVDALKARGHKAVTG